MISAVSKVNPYFTKGLFTNGYLYSLQIFYSVELIHKGSQLFFLIIKIKKTVFRAEGHSGAGCFYKWKVGPPSQDITKLIEQGLNPKLAATVQQREKSTNKALRDLISGKYNY